MLVINPPFRLDQDLSPALPVLARLMDEGGADSKLQWLKQEAG